MSALKSNSTSPLANERIQSHLWFLAFASFFFAFTGMSQGEGSGRFARGFLIYKSVPSDIPAYYNGTLYISESAVAIWKEYDIGQSRPFRITNNLVVQEIYFGALFEADFTSDAHLAFCKDVQAQLDAAAKQSPKLVKAAKAARDAIQAQIDKFEAFEVRFRGAWMKRSDYHAILNAEEAGRKAQELARVAKLKKDQEEFEAYQKDLAEQMAAQRAAEQAEQAKKAAEMAAIEEQNKRNANIAPTKPPVTTTTTKPELLEHLPTDHRLNSGSLLVDHLQVFGGKGKLILDNGLTEDAFVKMIGNGALVAAFYVRGGEKFTFDHVPDGIYRLMYCTGFGWDAGKRDFSRGRHAVRYDELLSYATTRRTEGQMIITSTDVLSLTLHKVTNGNTRTTDIPLEEFDRY